MSDTVGVSGEMVKSDKKMVGGICKKTTTIACKTMLPAS